MSPKSIFRLFGRARRQRKRAAQAQMRLIDLAARNLFLQGQMAAKAVDPAKRLSCLADSEFRVYSQWGEDGIVEWLVAHVDVPNDRFVEFGVETFEEANCRFLLQNRNWRGLVLDGSESNIAALRAQSLYWMHDLTGNAAFVATENIDGLIAAAGFGGPLGILSVDIDGNDYWIWQAITCVDPAIVICEVNPVFGDVHPVTVPYDSAFWRFKAHYSGLYFGASIGALCHLAEEKGYRFVGTSSTGINAFFVRDDLAPPVLALLDKVKAFPPRHRDSRDANGKMTYAGGLKRFELIADMPVVNVVTGETSRLGALGSVYSDEWLAAII